MINRNNEIKEIFELILEPYVDEDNYIEFKSQWNEIVGELENHKGKWLVEGENIGWQHLSGKVILDDLDAEKLLDIITPNGDWALKAKIYKSHIEARVTSHDQPIGAIYTLTPTERDDVNAN